MTIKYKIIAQYRNDLLHVKDISTDEYFMMDAREFVHNTALRERFDSDDNFLIGFICGQRAERHSDGSQQTLH